MKETEAILDEIFRLVSEQADNFSSKSDTATWGDRISFLWHATVHD